MLTHPIGRKTGELALQNAGTRSHARGEDAVVRYHVESICTSDSTSSVARCRVSKLYYGHMMVGVVGGRFGSQTVKPGDRVAVNGDVL